MEKAKLLDHEDWHSTRDGDLGRVHPSQRKSICRMTYELSAYGLSISCSCFLDALDFSTLHLAISVWICVAFDGLGVVTVKSQCSVCRRHTCIGTLSVCLRFQCACWACWFSCIEELVLHWKNHPMVLYYLLLTTVTKYLWLIALWRKDTFWSIVPEVQRHLLAFTVDLMGDGITTQMCTWITGISWWVQAQE